MEVNHLILFNATLLAAMAVLCAAILHLIHQFVAGGFSTGISTGMTLSSMASLWTAYCLWRNARETMAETATSGAQAFPCGLLVNLANAKSVVFAAFLSNPPTRAGYPRLKPTIDRIAGALFGALGFRLLFDR